jgi:MFS family permease
MQKSIMNESLEYRSSVLTQLNICSANGFPDNIATYSVVSGLWASSLSLGLFVGPTVGGILLDQSSYRVASLYPLVMAILNVR